MSRRPREQQEIINLMNNVIYSLRRNSSFSISNSYTSSLESHLIQFSELDSEFLRGKFRVKEQDILRNFTVLRYNLSCRELEENRVWDDILFPFLEIVKSGITTGHVTLIAIEGISLLLDFVHGNSVNLEHLVHAVTKCKFEATDSVNDEIVLANILKLLQKISRKFRLKNKEILAMIQVSLGMYFQNRISEFLKREALSTLTNLCKGIFKGSVNGSDNGSFNSDSVKNDAESKDLVQLCLLRLEIFKVISGLLDQENKNNIDSVHRNLGLYLLQVVLEEGGHEISNLISMGVKNHSQTRSLYPKRNSFILKEQDQQEIKEVNVKELQVQKIQQVPHLNLVQDDPSNTLIEMDNTRSEDAHEEELVKVGQMVKELIGNDICKAAFELIQAYDLSFNSPPSWPIISLIHQALKALCSLFRTNRMHLKYQMEWFIMWCIKSVDSGLLCWNIEDWIRSISSENNSQTGQNETLVLPHKRDILIGEIREMVLATLNMLILDETFLLDLYVNYDADMDMENNLSDNLLRFLAKHSFPDATYGGPVSSLPHQTLCFDSILLFLNHLVKRSDHKVDLDDHLPSSSSLSLNRSRKKVLIEGTMIFNENPKKGIPFLQEHGFLQIPALPSNIAGFLVENPFVDKKLLGLYLSKPDNQEILREFVKRLGFKGKRIDEALRTMLERFRLPGESQQIERILDAFAESFYLDMSKENSYIENASVACVLAYSIIMLHTDQHNPQRRMTFEDYSKNLRGCNEGKDFDQEIYDAIKGREILMPEEHGGHVGFSHIWKEIQAYSDAYHPLKKIPIGINYYDAELFSSVWSPILASLFYVFDNTEDGVIFEKSISGIRYCAKIAAAYDLSDVLDYIISSLAQVAGLNVNYRFGQYGSFGDNSSPSHSFRTPEDVAIELGRNLNQRIACYLLFSLIFSYPTVLKEGWNHMIKVYTFLVDNDLLPDYLKVLEDLNEEKFKITTLVDKKAQMAADLENSPRKEAGLLSTLTQLLSLSSAEEETAEVEKAKHISLAKICIDKCQLEKISFVSRSINDSSIILLMKAIMYASFRVDSPTTPINERVNPKTQIINEDVKLSSALPFMLNMMTLVVIENIHRFSVISDLYIDYLIKVSELLTDQIILVKCYVISVFSVTQALVEYPGEHNTSQIFNLLARIELSKFPFFLDQVLAGLSKILKISTPWLNLDSDSSATVFSILSTASMLPMVAESSFEVVCLVLDANSIRKEKYGECVDLLLSYPTSAATLSRGSSVRVSSGSADGESKFQAISNVSIKALDKLFDLRNVIPEWVVDSSSPKRAFFEFWLPILSGLSQQCYHPVRDIRQHAFSLLEKVILSKELNLDNDCSEIWISCFESVIFPLIEELVKINGMDETCSRAFALMCRLLLHISQKITHCKEVLNFWPRFLSCTRNYLILCNPDLKEAARESLKNLLLVLSTHDHFKPSAPNCKSEEPVDPQSLKEDFGETIGVLWTRTWNALEELLPQFRKELFPGD